MRGGRAIAILRVTEAEARTMRAYVAITEVAVGLIAVWAALAPFV